MPKFEGTNRIGEKRLQKCGYEATIVEYKCSRKLVVQFNDKNKTLKKGTYAKFRDGTLTLRFYPEKVGSNRIGESAVMNNGLRCTIIKYNRSDDIIVEFETGEQKHTNYAAFSKHSIDNRNHNYAEIYRNKKFYNKKTGLWYMIAKVEKSKFSLIWEDGAKSISESKYVFSNTARHPNVFYVGGKLAVKNFHGFTGIKVLNTNKNSYFKVRHINGYEALLTLSEMMRYE